MPHPVPVPVTQLFASVFIVSVPDLGSGPGTAWTLEDDIPWKNQ